VSYHVTRLALRGPLLEEVRRRLPVSGSRTLFFCSEPSLLLGPSGCGFPREPLREGEIPSCLIFQREGGGRSRRARAWLRAELPGGQRVDLALPLSGLAAGRLLAAYRPAASLELEYLQGHVDGCPVVAERLVRPGAREPQWVLEISSPEGEGLPAWAADLPAEDVSAAREWGHRALASDGPPALPRPRRGCPHADEEAGLLACASCLRARGPW
jgi:hypothetical protein